MEEGRAPRRGRGRARRPRNRKLRKSIGGLAWGMAISKDGDKEEEMSGSGGTGAKTGEGAADTPTEP